MVLALAARHHPGTLRSHQLMAEERIEPTRERYCGVATTSMDWTAMPAVTAVQPFRLDGIYHEIPDTSGI